MEDSHDVLTIEGVSTSISAHTTIVVHNGSIEVVVVEERTFVIDTYTGLCFPPLTGIPGAEGEVGLLVTEWVQSYVVLVTNGTGVTLVAILVCLVRIFRINRRIGIAGTDKYVQTIEQEVEFLRQLGIYPQLTLMGLVETGLLNLGNGVGITVRLVTTPDTC